MSGWHDIQTFTGKDYICGFCEKYVGPSIGYRYTSPGDHNFSRDRFILICPKCNKPTFFDSENQTPAPLLGNEVTNVPTDINLLYNEARNCTSTNAFTAAVLACRKLLMHIAVNKGADEGKRFIEYVEYLSDNNYVPPNGKAWVDHIREKGNEANHEIKIMIKDDALNLITFIEMLLKFIYEFPSRIPIKPSKPT